MRSESYCGIEVLLSNINCIFNVSIESYNSIQMNIIISNGEVRVEPRADI
jgi:hypothetical protein